MSAPSSFDSRSGGSGQTQDERFMLEALEEARRGLGRTRPNPPVGAVIVRGESSSASPVGCPGDGRVVIGRGFHRKVGLPHAEVEAIRQAGALARGADLYVTLEPCNHQGRTPPCTEAILDAGIRRVFAAVIDPNPLVSGSGLARLSAGGVEVSTGLLREPCEELIRPFAKHVVTGLPFVVLKAAATLDGKIATARGDSRWVSAPASRAQVHRWRDETDAVLVGAGTVRVDDPLLTTRLPAPAVPGREPRTAVRVVMAGMASLPASARILDASAGPVLLAVPASKSAAYWHLTRQGAELLPVEGADDRVDVRALLRALGERDVTSVLVEGGSAIFAAFLKAGAADELRLFIAPRIVGGDAQSWIAPLGIESMSGAWRVAGLKAEPFGDDLLVTGRPLAP